MMSTAHWNTESIEMYLKSISELEVTESPVSMTRLSQRLGISPPSAIEMVKRLAERDLVTHTPYKGVALTPLGRKRAHIILRRHRLWERFLFDRLGIAWEKVHDYACRLEHATDAEVADALAAFLNHPPDCPHGNPIPDAEGNIPELPALPLTDLEIGQSARLAYIAYEETVLLTYLAQRGFFPGVDLTLDDIAPYQGPLMIKIEDRIEALGREIAGRIFVLPA